MIYEFKTHCLFYENAKNIQEESCSLAVDTLEIICPLTTGKLLRVEGYLPLNTALCERIILPTFPRDSYCFKDLGLSSDDAGMVFDIGDIIPDSKKYFSQLLLRYDVTNGIIALGNGPNSIGVQVNENIFCCYDSGGVLSALILVPDRFV